MADQLTLEDFPEAPIAKLDDFPAAPLDDLELFPEAPLQVTGQPGAPLPGLDTPDLPPKSIIPTQPMGEFQPVSVAKAIGLKEIDRQKRPGSLVARFGKVFVKGAADISSFEDLLVLGPEAFRPDVLRKTPTKSLAKEAFGLDNRAALLRQMGVPQERIDRQADIVQLSQNLDELRRERIRILGLTTEPPQNLPETLVDTVAGLGAFITQLFVAKKLVPKAIPAHLRDAVAWEVQNIATGGPPGEGAGMALGLGAIQALPIPGPAKLVAESAAFGLLAKAQGASDVDFYIALAIPPALRGMGVIRAKLDIDLRAAKTPEAAAEVMTRAKEAGDKARAEQGVPEPTLEEAARGLAREDVTVLVKGKQSQITPDQADRITSTEGVPSRNDLKGIPGTEKLSAEQRSEIKSNIQEQLDAKARTQEQATREPTQTQEAQAKEEVVGTAKVRALDRSTGEITDISVAPENTVRSLRGERRTRGQLKRLLDCLSRV